MFTLWPRLCHREGQDPGSAETIKAGRCFLLRSSRLPAAPETQALSRTGNADLIKDWLRVAHGRPDRKLELSTDGETYYCVAGGCALVTPHGAEPGRGRARSYLGFSSQCRVEAWSPLTGNPIHTSPPPSSEVVEEMACVYVGTRRGGTSGCEGDPGVRWPRREYSQPFQKPMRTTWGFKNKKIN